MRDMWHIFTGFIFLALVVFAFASGVQMAAEVVTKRVTKDCSSMGVFRVEGQVFECSKIVE